MRAPSRLGLLLIGLLSSAAHAQPEAPLLLFVVEPGLQCPSQPALLAALEKELGAGRVGAGGPAGAGPLVEVRRRSERELQLSLRDRSGARQERVVSAAGTECVELPYSIVLILRAYFQDLPWLELPSRQAHPATVPLVRPPPPPPPPAPRRRPPTPPPTPAPPPAPIDEPDLVPDPEPAPSIQSTPDEPSAKVEPSAPPAAPAAPPPSDFGFAASLLGGASSAFEANQLAGQAALFVEGRWSRFGLGLVLAAHGPIERGLGPGTVAVTAQQLALSLSFSPRGLKQHGALGPWVAFGGERIEALARGFTEARLVRLSWWGAVGLRYEQPLWRSLGLVATAYLGLRGAGARIQVENQADAFVVRPMRAGVLVGLGWLD